MPQTEPCQVETALRAIGGKWKLLILRVLLVHQRLRYNELLREIPDISAKELTRNLRGLENQGLVNRIGESQEQHVVYEATATASELHEIFHQLGEWATKHTHQLGRTQDAEKFVAATTPKR